MKNIKYINYVAMIIHLIPENYDHSVCAIRDLVCAVSEPPTSPVVIPEKTIIIIDIIIHISSTNTYKYTVRHMERGRGK